MWQSLKELENMYLDPGLNVQSVDFQACTETPELPMAG
jgi:hypothetical protein